MTQRFSPWLYFLLVFAGGIATGFFGDRVFATRPVIADTAPHSAEEWKRHYIDDLKRRCALTQDQVSRVNTVLEETHKQADALRARIAPEMTALHNQQVKEVRELLTDGQKPAYDQFRAERDAQRKAERR